MTKRLTAAMLCVVLATGCASSGMRIADAAPAPVIDQQVMRDYVQRLPAGSRVRVEQTDGRSFRGTLLKATTDAIVVQKNTRIPEAPVEVRLDRLARITLDQGGNNATGRAIGIGIASGVGATLAFLAILAAAIGD